MLVIILLCNNIKFVITVYVFPTIDYGQSVQLILLSSIFLHEGHQTIVVIFILSNKLYCYCYHYLFAFILVVYLILNKYINNCF